MVFESDPVSACFPLSTSGKRRRRQREDQRSRLAAWCQLCPCVWGTQPRLSLAAMRLVWGNCFLQGRTWFGGSTVGLGVTLLPQCELNMELLFPF